MVLELFCLEDNQILQATSSQNFGCKQNDMPYFPAANNISLSLVKLPQWPGYVGEAEKK
jgi:hypothetical protein